MLRAPAGERIVGSGAAVIASAEPQQAVLRPAPVGDQLRNESAVQLGLDKNVGILRFLDHMPALEIDTVDCFESVSFLS